MHVRAQRAGRIGFGDDQVHDLPQYQELVLVQKTRRRVLCHGGHAFAQQTELRRG